MATGRRAVSARQRAREAKAAFDRDRVEREKKIENLVMSYYVADDAEQAAQEALEAATRDRAQTVRDLEALGLATKHIALLCGIEAADVRALRRALKRVENDDATSGVTEHTEAVAS